MLLCKQAPAESVTSSEPPPPTPPSVVEAYRAKVNSERQQQREQQQQPHLTVESDNSYRRADSDYSIDNLSQLFNAGDDATPRYLLAIQPPVHSLPRFDEVLFLVARVCLFIYSSVTFLFVFVLVSLRNQKLSYRKQIARKLRTPYVDGIVSNSVTFG